ncbi:Protein THYLAKOID ASSEMBLY 8-like chloroplastic [Bienertia sinuspersici]
MEEGDEEEKEACCGDEFQKETWYTPDLALYYDMILVLGKNKLIHKAEELFTEPKKEGLQPDVRA